MAIDSALQALIDAKLPPSTVPGSQTILVQAANDAMVAIAQFYQNKRVVSCAVTGSGTDRTLVLTLGDGSTIESDFTLPSGGGTPALTFHFGTLPSGATPSEADIEALTAQAIPSGGAKVFQFTNTADEFLGIFWPATEPDVTQYYVGPLDNGPLGGGGTFSAPVTVGAYKGVITTSQTQIPTPVTLS